MWTGTPCRPPSPPPLPTGRGRDRSSPSPRPRTSCAASRARAVGAWRRRALHPPRRGGCGVGAVGAARHRARSRPAGGMLVRSSRRSRTTGRLTGAAVRPARTARGRRAAGRAGRTGEHRAATPTRPHGSQRWTGGRTGSWTGGRHRSPSSITSTRHCCGARGVAPETGAWPEAWPGAWPGVWPSRRGRCDARVTARCWTCVSRRRRSRRPAVRLHWTRTVRGRRRRSRRSTTPTGQPCWSSRRRRCRQVSSRTDTPRWYQRGGRHCPSPIRY